MKDSEKLKQDLINDIKENPEKYPFIAQFWEINIINKTTVKQSLVEFGHYQTSDFNSYPFYKPFSKIIDFSKIDE